LTGFWSIKTALTRSKEDIRDGNSNDPSCIYNISQNLPHPDPLSFVKEALHEENNCMWIWICGE